MTTIDIQITTPNGDTYDLEVEIDSWAGSYFEPGYCDWEITAAWCVIDEADEDGDEGFELTDEEIDNLVRDHEGLIDAAIAEAPAPEDDYEGGDTDDGFALASAGWGCDEDCC